MPDHHQRLLSEHPPSPTEDLLRPGNPELHLDGIDLVVGRSALPLVPHVLVVVSVRVDGERTVFHLERDGREERGGVDGDDRPHEDGEFGGEGERGEDELLSRWKERVARRRKEKSDRGNVRRGFASRAARERTFHPTVAPTLSWPIDVTGGPTSNAASTVAQSTSFPTALPPFAFAAVDVLSSSARI